MDPPDDAVASCGCRRTLQGHDNRKRNTDAENEENALHEKERMMLQCVQIVEEKTESPQIS